MLQLNLQEMIPPTEVQSADYAMVYLKVTPFSCLRVAMCDQVAGMTPNCIREMKHVGVSASVSPASFSIPLVIHKIKDSINTGLHIYKVMS